ncbi:methyltransferase domain-containing protein [Pantoea allii]|uniref:methyltransferase domain-containing protein n=1 Tax=Pantoea allii TaxID=574096 RepID=UPI003977727C
MQNNYRLPADYNSRVDYEKYIDGHDSLDSTVYQPHVYKSAFEIVKRTNAKYLIDIGCGDGSKVAQVRLFHPDCRVIMIDHEYIIDNVVKRYDFAQYISADFDVEIPAIDESILKESVIICSDVVEHLLKPEIIIEFFRQCKHLVKAIVISTPDRVEERGYFDYGPPANPYHVREWTLDEFTRLLMDFGFRDRMLAGLTISNDYNNVKATLFCVISKYIEYEAPCTVNIKKIVSKKNAFIKDIKKIFDKKDVNTIKDDDWYLIDSESGSYFPLMLKVSVEDSISLAHYHGFNTILKTSLETRFDDDKKIKAGEVKMNINSNEEPIGAIKGELIRKIFNNEDVEIKSYIFNLLNMNNIKFKEKRFLFERLKNKKMPLSQWHENITRKEYIVELAFGGKIK